MLCETQLQTRELEQIEDMLRKKIFEEGRIIDSEKGYLSLPWVNELIDPKLQRSAAKLIAYRLTSRLEEDDHNLTKVVGVPTMGTYLATALAEELEKPLVVACKGCHIPNRWTKAVRIEENMKRYNNGAVASHIYNCLEPGDIALFVDDILGDGDTLTPIIDWAKQHGITPYVGVYVAKLYRPGYQKMLDLGVRPVFAYGIANVHNNGKFSLSSQSNL